jgi:hypothetical protein
MRPLGELLPTYVMGIFHSLVVLIELMNTLSLGQANITFNNGSYAMLSQLLKQMVVPYL